jgi:O-antigen ligase
MTALAIGVGGRTAVSARSHAVLLLQVFGVTLMVFPSDEVIKTVGAGGYVAALVSYCLFLAWLAATIFGQHNPLDRRSPVRFPLCALWLVSLASYLLINRAVVTPLEMASADRWLMQLAGTSGVVLVASECLRSVDDIKRVLRALIWGGAFCGIVAALQFKLGLDLTHYLHLPGFSLNQAAAGNAGIGSRGSFNRVPGTAIDPIELGVVAGMLLPLAIYLALHDLDRSASRRWIPVICIGLAIPASVSRSAFLAVGVSLGVLIVTLPPARRLWGLGGIAASVAFVFVIAHGLIGTLKSYFTAGNSDPSIAHRTGNYPFVEQMVRKAPWLGQGGGTYIAQSTAHILDNQFLTMAIELGLLGVAALAFFLLWPPLAALVARGRTADRELRDLCAALAGAGLAAALCSGTFDSLSFPMFANVQALVVGLTGAAWLVIRQPGASVTEPG